MTPQDVLALATVCLPLAAYLALVTRDECRRYRRLSAYRRWQTSYAPEQWRAIVAHTWSEWSKQ